MQKKRNLSLAAAVLAALIFAGSALASGYWFYNGNLSGAVFNYPTDGSTDWARMSFDNTNHPGHRQNIVVLDSNGNWTSIGVWCSGGSGCDSGDVTIDATYYPKGGCQVPSSYGYAVWTNCKYNNLYP